MDKKDDNFFKYVLLYLALLVAIVFGMTTYFMWAEKQTKQYTYELKEIDSGIYVVYYEVHSSIPSQNYSVVKFCDNNRQYTYRGDVTICFIDDNAIPHAKITIYTKLSTGEDIWLYVPKNSIEYQENVGLD